MWDVFHGEIKGAVSVGEIVLLITQLRYRGKGSGIDAESPAGHLLKFRDGKIVSMRAFRNPEAALETVGLRE